VVPLCTGVVLVGGRMGTGGRRERAVARRVVDLLGHGAEPPTSGVFDIDWAAARSTCLVASNDSIARLEDRITKLERDLALLRRDVRA
jgi:hypothetical protein